MLTAFDAETLGHRRRGRRRPASRCRTSTCSRTGAGVHTRRLHQRRPAARDARAGPSAGLLHHRNADGRARGPREDGSGRVPHQEPPAARRRTRCGASTSRSARRAVRLGQAACRPAIRRRVRSSAAWAARPTGGAAAAAARRRTCEIMPDGSVVVRCGTQDLGTGTRTLVAIDHGRDAGPADRGHQGRDRRQQLPVQRRRRRQHDGAVGLAGDSRHGEQGARRAGRARSRRRSASTGDAVVASNGRIHVKDDPSKGLAWKDACKLLGTTPVSVDGAVGGGPLGQRHERRAVRRGRRSTSRPASRR